MGKPVTKNYMDEGGDRLVIGGTLELKEGAVIEGDSFGVIKSHTVILIDDDEKSLPTLPFVLVPAPGAGKVRIPTFAFLQGFNAGNYTNFDDDFTYFDIDWDADTFEPMAMFVNDAASGVSDATVLINTSSYFLTRLVHPPTPLLTWTERPVLLGGIGSSPNIENVPIVLACYNAAGNFTGGDPANTLKITTFYMEVDL